MIKVLHVINGASLGGISSMILNYYRCIDREKVHFDFVTSSENGYNGVELEKLGSKFYLVQMKSKDLRSHILTLNRVMRTEHFDAIHVHSNHTSYVALIVAWINHIPIRFAHGHNAVKEKLGLKAQLSRRVGIVLNRIFSTRRLACSSDAAVYTFGRHSLKEKTLSILPNAIDVNKFSFDKDKRNFCRKVFSLESDELVVGCVGRMSEEKNQQHLLNSFASLCKQHSKSKLILVGDGEERNRLENLAKNLKIDRQVIFTGQRTDVSLLLNAFDVFVMPSIYEGFPIAGIEALANGLPLVLSDTITRELEFTDYSKYVSLNKSYDTWADEIYKQGFKQHDEKLAELVREQGFDINKAAKKLENYYMGLRD